MKKKYKIIKQSDDIIRKFAFLCKDESGNEKYLDLFTDSSYRGFGHIHKGDCEKKYAELIGKTIEVEEIFPYTPLYFATNVKLLKD